MVVVVFSCFVPVYLRTPGYKLMIVLRRVPGLPVGGTIQNTTVTARGVVTALKPVRAEQVRRPE